MPTNFMGVLADKLSHPVPGVLGHEVTSLAWFRKQQTMVLTLQSQGLEDIDVAVRRVAVQRLQRFGPQVRPALPELLALVTKTAGSSWIASMPSTGTKAITW